MPKCVDSRVSGTQNDKAHRQNSMGYLNKVNSPIELLSRCSPPPLKVPCSYELTAMRKVTLLVYMSEFRLRVSSF